MNIPHTEPLTLTPSELGTITQALMSGLVAVNGDETFRIEEAHIRDALRVLGVKLYHVYSGEPI